MPSDISLWRIIIMQSGGYYCYTLFIIPWLYIPDNTDEETISEILEQLDDFQHIKGGLSEYKQFKDSVDCIHTACTQLYMENQL